jgi:hypothetical protein
VLGSFQLTIPVSTKSEILVPEEQLYSVMRWVQETIPPANRWRPVFHRYVGQLAGKIVALGGDPNAIPPTGTGVWPGLGGHEPAGDSHGRSHGEHREFTGKIKAIVYDTFGDFEAFVVETRSGQRHRIESHEKQVHVLVQQVWSQRILVKIVVHRDRADRPIEISIIA